MKASIGEIRVLVRQAFLEAFDKEMFDDPEIGKPSVLVPGATKRKIKRWLKTMKLSRSDKRSRSA